MQSTAGVEDVAHKPKSASLIILFDPSIVSPDTLLPDTLLPDTLLPDTLLNVVRSHGLASDLTTAPAPTGVPSGGRAAGCGLPHPPGRESTRSREARL